MKSSLSSNEITTQKVSLKNIGESKKQENQNTSSDIYKKDLEKLSIYQQKLQSFNQKLKSKKRKFNFLLKENLSKLATQESEIEKQLNTLSDQIKKVKMQKEATDQQISQQKYLLIKLEDEKKQLSKTDKWAETTFSESSNQNPTVSTRDSILQILDELDNIKEKSRSLRSKIFYYQKQLLKLSDDISPVTIQIYFLQAQIDFENENELNNQELSTKKQNTIKAAVAAQQLTIEKMKLEKQIDQMNVRIEEIKKEKNQILKRLAPMKSTEKETILKSILEQVNQYEEASLRRKSYQENEILSVHDSITKELEIKIEIDEVQNELKEVNRQKEELKNIIIQKKTEINSLQNILATSNVQEISKDPLHELILQIKQLRDEGIKIAQQVPREFSIDHSDLLKVRQDLDIQYDQLKLSVEQQLDLNRQMKKEILRRRANSENRENINQDNEVIIPDTPKIILLKKRINDMENEVSNYHQKTQKKILKINKKKAEFESCRKKLDLNSNLNFLKAELANRFERSMTWFLQIIRSQIKLLFSQNINIIQIINDWDSKIISAVINETEDFILKSSILC